MKSFANLLVALQETFQHVNLDKMVGEGDLGNLAIEFIRRTPRTSAVAKRKRQRTRTCRIEELESREMLSVAPWNPELFYTEHDSIVSSSLITSASLETQPDLQPRNFFTYGTEPMVITTQTIAAEDEPSQVIDSPVFNNADTIYAHFAIRNAGAVAAVPFTCTLALTGDNLVTPTVINRNFNNGLQPGHWAWYNNIDLGTLADGEYTLTLAIDSDNTVEEADEANNTYTKTFVVGTPYTPATPSGFTATPGSERVRLSWNAVSNATHYILERSPNDTNNWERIGGDVTGISYMDTRLAANTAYHYRISAVNTTATSAPSDSTQATPFFLPVPELSSLPGAEYAIFLNFNGNEVGTTLNASDGNAIPPFDLDGNPYSFSDEELQMIHDLWLYTSEMFCPFNINVTTVEAEAVGKMGSHVCFGGAGAGGAGFLNMATIGETVSAMVTMPNSSGLLDFPRGLQGTGQTIVHEVGHNFGLIHDGPGRDDYSDSNEYYPGHNVIDATDTAGYWNAVMGGTYYNDSLQIIQFSMGEYPDATNQEDDLKIISDRTGYRPDSDLVFEYIAGQNIAKGIIETSGDEDSYTFNVVESAEYTFTAISGVTIQDVQVSSLYYVLTLKDADGDTVFEEYSPLNSFFVTRTIELGAGEYTLSIAGAGIAATAEQKGFSNYGSLGFYEIVMSANVLDLLGSVLDLLN